MRYAAYRSIDELWLTIIPDHWSSRKVKYVFTERIEKDYPNEPLLVASQNMGVVPKGVYGSRTVEATKDLHNLKLVRVGDFVISLRSFQGGLEYAYYQGIISPAYTVMIPNNHISGGYFRYLAKSKLFIELLQMCVTGIREGQNIDYGKLKNHLIPLPPRDEQDQIVRYLDWKVTQINRLIKIKRRQIALLQEQKRGIVSSRLSGELVWLKRLLSSPFQYGANNSGVEYSSSLARYIRITDISLDGRLKVEGAKSLSDEIAEPYILSDGDVLFARSGATAGKSFLYKAEYGLCAFAGYLIRVRVDTKKLLPEYLIYVTNSSGYEQWRNSVFIQATIQNISAERYGQLPVPVPSLNEQQSIVTCLDAQCGRIDSIVNKLTDEIALFVEYRTRLISDVVTGKVDVRGVVVPEYEVVEDVSGDIDEMKKMQKEESSHDG